MVCQSLAGNCSEELHLFSLSSSLYPTCMDTAWIWTGCGSENSWGSETRNKNSPVLQRDRKDIFNRLKWEKTIKAVKGHSVFCCASGSFCTCGYKTQSPLEERLQSPPHQRLPTCSHNSSQPVSSLTSASSKTGLITHNSLGPELGPELGPSQLQLRMKWLNGLIVTDNRHRNRAPTWMTEWH